MYYAVNYVTRYALSGVVIIAFYYALKAECAATASGLLYRPIMIVQHPQIQVKEQAGV
jgi:hypothetical protein